MSAKRGAAGAGAAPKRARAQSPGVEERTLVAALSARKPTRKEIESTEVGGASTIVDRTLPSFFDFYPRAKRAYEALRGAARADRLRLLRACDAVNRTGDASAMGAHVAAALAGEAGAATAPIDVDADDGAPDAEFRWQVDGGDAGWLDFDAASNAAAEKARREGAETTVVSNRFGVYDLNLSFMVQINRHTGTARPVRMVS